VLFTTSSAAAVTDAAVHCKQSIVIILRGGRPLQQQPQEYISISTVQLLQQERHQSPRHITNMTSAASCCHAVLIRRLHAAGTRGCHMAVWGRWWGVMDPVEWTFNTLISAVVKALAAILVLSRSVSGRWRDG